MRTLRAPGQQGIEVNLQINAEMATPPCYCSHTEAQSISLVSNLAWPVGFAGPRNAGEMWLQISATLKGFAASAFAVLKCFRHQVRKPSVEVYVDRGLGSQPS